VVFLDVDDDAVAYNGVFPWPRSVMADGYLRLKEYGAAAAVMDIEFIDDGPKGIDTVYFDQGFPLDFESAFSGIGVNVSDLLAAVRTGRIRGNELPAYEGELLDLIQDEKEILFQRVAGIARDNDEYLARSSALFGHTWATVNLQSKPLSGEQAERRPQAEEKFAYPLKAAPGAREGSFVDILPPIPIYAEAARGAGFTNVFIDRDGVRRRIFLAQKVYDHWYLQLAFAPLVEYLGNPEITLEKRRLVLKNARIPVSNNAGSGAAAANIVIPLDTGGRMMLDWPKTSYQDSFTHISFALFSNLEELEIQMEQYLTDLEKASFPFFIQFDETLYAVPGTVRRARELFTAAREERNAALAENSDDAFNRYIAIRADARGLIRSLTGTGMGEKIRALAEILEREYPEDASLIREEAEYIALREGYLKTVLEQYEAAEDHVRAGIEGKFCIIGRVDTGTTDIGVNPFFGEYVNVGTHAVVLDTILSQSFITVVHPLWSAALCLILTPLLILVLSGLTPGLRGGMGIAAALLFGLFTFVLFRFTGIFIGPLGPMLSIAIAVVARELIAFVISDKEKQFINKAFSTYLSGDVVKELIADPSLLQLGGSKRRMSAVFTDIQGFSTISEQLDPSRLVNLLNRYLTEMSDIIMENRGTIDKYEGDAIIAFFGAPVYMEDHAVLACRSAVRMKQAEITLNKKIVEENLSPAPLFTRIGINTGEMVVGNMGTETKMNYTIMGNDVNLASRLEGVNRQYHTGGILISEYTRKEIGDEFICRTLDRVRVVGINEPVRIYEIMGFAGEASDSLQKTVELFGRALDIFEAQDWTAAAAAFEAVLSHCHQDGPSQIYLDRCRRYSAKAPEQWDGVFTLDQK
jgi:adenylate cyclase